MPSLCDLRPSRREEGEEEGEEKGGEERRGEGRGGEGRRGEGGEGREERGGRRGEGGEGCDNFKPMQQLQLGHVQDMWMCFSSTRCFCTDECCYNSLLVCLQITTAISNVQLYTEHAGNTNQQGTHTNCSHEHMF